LIFFNNINLENYRNFNNLNLIFDQKCNILYGSNGSGKTNILESLSLFEKGRGFRKENINNLYNKNNTNKIFKISSSVTNNNENIDLLVTNEIKEQTFKKKIFVNNSDSRESLNYFETLFSIISFLPEMERIFQNRTSERRNFFDRLIYGVDRKYIKLLNEYKKKLIERTKILKNNIHDLNWLNQIEIEIVNLGIEIYKKRNNYISKLNTMISKLNKPDNKLYNINFFIDDKLSSTELDDEHIKNLYLNEIKENREIDTYIGGAKVGPHKSDIRGINNFTNLNINQYSTGQQKTIILLIIVAQSKLLIDEYKRKPIILFDEICSHLDQNNRDLLLELIETLDIQTLMTGTEKKLFSFLSTKVSYFNININ